MCQYLMRPCSDGNRMSLGVCGRFTAAELFSFTLAITVVCIWVMTGSWVLMDFMGIALCVAFIAFVRLPSLKVSTLLLIGLLIYDVFWVFFSSYIFSTNVMVKVATRPAEVNNNNNCLTLPVADNFVSESRWYCCEKIKS